MQENSGITLYPFRCALQPSESGSQKETYGLERQLNNAGHPFLDEKPPFYPYFAFFRTISTFSSIAALLFQGKPIVRPIFLFYNKFISRILRIGSRCSRACTCLLTFLIKLYSTFNFPILQFCP